jgi:hypothetical protein
LLHVYIPKKTEWLTSQVNKPNTPNGQYDLAYDFVCQPKDPKIKMSRIINNGWPINQWSNMLNELNTEYLTIYATEQ